MPKVSEYASGAPCWAELDSPDVAASRKFYERLFGWRSYVLSHDFYGDYVLWTTGGPEQLEVAGLDALADSMQPSRWLCYFAADDLGPLTERVRTAGGHVFVDDTEAGNVGRFALAEDPEGVDFGLWKGSALPGATVVAEPGSMCWMELTCRDLKQAQHFYGQVLGWTFVKSDHDGLTYSCGKVADRSVVGLVVLDEQLRPLDQPLWMPYFAVDHCDATVTKATKLGAVVDVPPRNIRPGRYALMKDPLGAPLAIIQPLHPSFNQGEGVCQLNGVRREAL